jgi:hypothetical protein
MCAKKTEKSTTTTKKKTQKKPTKPVDEAKRVRAAVLSNENIVTGTRRRKEVNYNEAKLSKAGHAEERAEAVTSVNTSEKRGAAKIEKKKKMKKALGDKSSSTDKKKKTTTSKKDE